MAFRLNSKVYIYVENEYYYEITEHIHEQTNWNRVLDYEYLNMNNFGEQYNV